MRAVTVAVFLGSPRFTLRRDSAVGLYDDIVLPCPAREPATWATMLAGLGVVGSAISNPARPPEHRNQLRRT